jgi:hypothetical protein
MFHRQILGAADIFIESNFIAASYALLELRISPI